METSKKGFLRNNPISKFIIESAQELKKVVWPKKKDVINKTLIIIAAIIIVSSLLGAIDYGLTEGIKFLINIK